MATESSVGPGGPPLPGPLVARPEAPARRRARRMALRLLVLGGLLAGLVAAHRPLLSAYARMFRVDDPAPSDAIVLLLGGLGHRPQRAVELYRRGLAPRIVFATLDEAVTPFQETAETIKALERAGVPRDAITVLPDRCESTRDEAVAVRKMVQRAGYRRITVITSAQHTRRARWIFRRILDGTGVEIHMAAVDVVGLDDSDWWHSDEGLVTYFSETLKLVYYLFRY